LICSPSRALLVAAFLVSALIPAAAQTPTRLERQLSHVDLGISGAGEFTRSVSGPIVPTGASNYNTLTTQAASNTLGAMANIRYTPRPLVGLEFNYAWARYTESFTPAPATPTVAGSVFPLQTTYNEYTLGYIITPAHTLFGLQPFASAGLGSIEFKPTAGGGDRAPIQARAAYYYNVGLQQEFHDSHFGLRVSFRQVFFLAPDYGQNYLTILKHTTATQPTAGFFLRF
jgi:hypothetical protein